METDYWHSLDKESPFRINPKTLGVSTAITKKGIDQLKARVFEGARNVELGFMGKEKGSLGQGGITPEMHTKEEREDIRQLAKINEVDLSTHASVAVGSTSGLTQQGFKDEERMKAVNEIKRTVDFAADVAQGGPVVVHTGEFTRPVYEAGKEFRAYEGEEEKAPVYFVDQRTGDLKGIDRDKDIAVIEKNEKGEYKRTDKGELDIEFKNYNKIKDEFEKLPKVERDKFQNHPEKYFYNKIKEEEVGRYEVEGEHFDIQSKSIGKQIEELKGQQMMYESMRDKDLTDQQVEQIRQGNENLAKASNEKIRSIFKNPDPQIEAIQGNIDSLDVNKRYYEDGAANYKRTAATVREEVKNIVPVEEYGVKKTADSLATSAMYAYDKEKVMKLKKALFVAPENIFPEQYGSHPRELKNLVLEARKQMVDKLKVRGMAVSQAEKVAKEHIKATFDVGHANTWKKFFKREPGESLEQSEKKFKTWLVKQTEELQKEGIIGHVHLSDNFGYYDEHLAPGEGNVPIKELIDKLDKAGYKGKTIVEWGAQTPEQSFRVWSKSLGLSSSTYKMDGNWSWTDIQGSYFGRTGSPTYLVGEDVPSKDWTLWSETQLE